MAGQLSNEQLLLRWFNFHLKHNDQKPISNFSKDICDSEAYFSLFERLNMIKDGNDEVISLINEGRSYPTSEKEKRAECILKISQLMDCKRFINVNRIVNGHARLNLSFVATIFNKYSNVNLTDEESMAYVRELIRRIRLKDNEQYLPLDQEIEYVKGILAKNEYISSIFYKLYGDRLDRIEWLNEYALDDTFEKQKEEAILKEMSEIEKRDNTIEELKKQLEELQTKYDSDIEQKNGVIEERDNKIKELEEMNTKQKETFKSFKKDVNEQLLLIETMMKNDMNRINRIDQFDSTDELNNDDNNDEETSNKDNNKESSNNDSNNSLNNLHDEIDKLSGDNGLSETYKKVEVYVKRLLEELKKAKEQNYIYKSQIAQNDKINALLNEKIYQFSEKACLESNLSSHKSKSTSKPDLSKKKKFVPPS